jgi:hypothetical protein
MSKKDIPDLPSKLTGKFKKPPAPPKYLIGANGEVVMGSPPDNRPANAPAIPSTSKWSAPIEPKSLRESRGFGAEPKQTNYGKHYNSTSNDDRSMSISYTSAKGQEVNSRTGVKGTPKDKDDRAPIEYVGTSYTHKANHFVAIKGGRGFPKPADVVISRPYVPLAPSKDQWGNELSGLLHNRKVSGKIIGDVRKRTVDASNVPYLDPSQAPSVPGYQPSATGTIEAYRFDEGEDGLGPPPYGVGPDNPSRQLDDTWAAYWDDEAGAVYYYNGVTGEASWIPPL